MKTMKLLIIAMSLLMLNSCQNDDDNSPQNNPPVLDDITLNVSEDLTSDLITTITATDLDGDTLSYRIVSQSPAGSIIINANTGEVFVGNASAFDHDQNTVITATIEVSDGEAVVEALLTINITEAVENGRILSFGLGA